METVTRDILYRCADTCEKVKGRFLAKYRAYCVRGEERMKDSVLVIDVVPSSIPDPFTIQVNTPQSEPFLC